GVDLARPGELDPLAPDDDGALGGNGRRGVGIDRGGRPGRRERRFERGPDGAGGEPGPGRRHHRGGEDQTQRERDRDRDQRPPSLATRPALRGTRHIHSNRYRLNAPAPTRGSTSPPPPAPGFSVRRDG